MAESSAAGAARRRPRKLGRNRSDQESVLSGQKHTLLEDTDFESVYQAASEHPPSEPRSRIQDIEEEETPPAPPAAEASRTASAAPQPALEQSNQQQATSCPRRRPRKLLRNASATGAGPSSSGVAGSGGRHGLDVRVTRLETQVQTLSRRLDSTSLEVSRLISSTRASTLPDDIAASPPTMPPVQADIMRNAQAATSQLERVNPSLPPGRSNALAVIAAADDADVEDIPRADFQGSTGGDSRPVHARTVSLTGNYKIPLPSSLSANDVRAIRDGVFAAGSLAKEITAALRMTHGGSETVGAGPSTAGAADVLPGPGSETPRTSGSWARLIEGASQLVQKAAHAIELDAAVEASGSASKSGGAAARPTRQTQANAQTKWRKKTVVRTPDNGPNGAGTPTPTQGAAAEASTDKRGEGKKRVKRGRSTSGAKASAKAA